MAQKTAWTGAGLTESDINTYLMGEGGAWTSHTPQIDQGGSTNIAKTVTYSKYARRGRMITWNFSLALTAGGTAGSAISLTLPATATATAAVCGSGRIYDSSTTTTYAGSWVGLSTTTVTLIHDASGANAWGILPNLAVASGDDFVGSITYEAAS
jgi:hypothetical protein